jgi:hypothetical protein
MKRQLLFSEETVDEANMRLNELISEYFKKRGYFMEGAGKYISLWTNREHNISIKILPLKNDKNGHFVTGKYIVNYIKMDAYNDYEFIVNRKEITDLETNLNEDLQILINDYKKYKLKMVFTKK